jgi:hypothetical protein
MVKILIILAQSFRAAVTTVRMTGCKKNFPTRDPGKRNSFRGWATPSGDPLVTMMQSAKRRDRHDASLGWELDFSRDGRIPFPGMSEAGIDDSN